MAQKFSIIELVPNDEGPQQKTGVRFDWDAKTHTLPVSPWDFGLKQRTHREDYPGYDQPQEQILGPSFKPFTLKGRWKDRWAGEGYAVATWKAFEALTRRGNPCKFLFGEIEVIGILEEVDFSYRRDWDIGYSFTVSPHYREGQKKQDDTKSKEAGTPPNDYAERVKATVVALQIIHSLAPARYIKGTLYVDVGAKIADLIDRSATIARITESRTFIARPISPEQDLSDVSVVTSSISAAILSGASGAQPATSVGRLLQAFEGMRQSAATMLDVTRAMTTAELFNPQTIVEAQFDSWLREIMAQSRVLQVQCWDAAQELRRRTTPDALALYRPRAGESLYSIGNKFQVNWRSIYDRNNLTTLELEGTELLVIPGVH